MLHQSLQGQAMFGETLQQGAIQHTSGLQPYSNTLTKPRARDGLQGTSALQEEGDSPGQPRQSGQLSGQRHSCRASL